MASSSILKKSSALILGALVASAAVTGPGPLATRVRAQDAGALLNILVKKGVLSDQEAEDVRAELQKESATTPAGKLNISSGLTELKFSGDIRSRFEYRSAENGDTGDSLERNRFRYRFRLGLTGRLTDGWFFGARLETANGNRSTNVTEGNYSLAPFGKDAANTIYIGQVYLGRTMGGFTLTTGRFANPLVVTPMVWDDDINVEGFAEQWTHTAGNTTLFVNLEQLVYYGVGLHNAFNAPGTPNTFLFGNQFGVRVKFATTATFQIAPAYYAYSNAGSAYPPTAGPGSATLRPASLAILDMPLEFNAAIGEIPLKIWGDFAINLDAADRAAAAAAGMGVPAYAEKENEDTAFQIGVALGSAKARGGWELRAFYQEVAAFALDTNLVDSDLFDSRTNMKGLGLAGTYALSDAVSVKLTYASATRKTTDLPAFGAGDIATVTPQNYQLFQADLSVKF
jgi:polyhydroxyalkanoate synthesis regulator phasin